MKRLRGVAGIVAAGLLSGAASAATVTRIVAVVNDDVVTNADLELELHDLVQDEEARLPEGMDEAQLRRLILTRLIERKLILQEAKKQGIAVTLEDVAERLDLIRRRHGSEEEFENALAESGMSEERLKEQIRDQLLVNELIDQKVRAGIVVSPQEVATELQAHPEEIKSGDRVRARHLLIRAGDTRSPEEAKQLVEKLRSEIAGGAPFAEVAARHSEDPTAQEGGLMEWVAQGDLLPELDAALFALQPGQVSEPIVSKLGCHLLTLEERTSAADLSTLEANTAVYHRLFQAKFQQAFTRWIGEIKRKAYVEVLDTER